MSDRKKILIALDRSRQSMEAARFITKILPTEKLEVVLFMDLNKMPEAYWDVAKDNNFDLTEGILPVIEMVYEREKAADEFMEQARQLVLEAGVPPEAITVNIHNKKLGIARDIIAEAERDHYRAVVIGRTGRSKIKDFMLGSIAHKITQQLRGIPVWTIGGTPDIKKILVALDSSGAALRVIEYVVEMLADTNTKITLFHATRELGIYRDGKEKKIDSRYEEKWQQIIEEKMRSIFNCSTNQLVKAGIKRDNIEIKFEQKVASRAGAIIKEAHRGNYGALVAGRSGLTHVNGFMMGRVTNKLIQHAGEMAVCIVD